MQELDFSAQIKAANFNFAPKTHKFEGFKLSENGEKFLSSIASETNKEILSSVAQNAIQAAKGFHRVGFSDVEVAVARICRFANYGDAKMLTANHVDLDDIEYALAKVTVAKNKLQTSDFLAVAEEAKAEACDCEESEMEEMDGKKVCKTCGKATKAKKSC